MRPLQLWLKSRVPQNAWRMGTLRIKVTRDCLHTLTPWRNMTLCRRGVHIDQVIRRKNVRPAFGTWSETEKSWHINCLELHALHLALECFLADILHSHIFIRTDIMTVAAFINHQGGVNSRPLLRLARDRLLWADRHLLSIRAVHVPRHLNYGAYLLSRGGVIHGEWRLHPLTVNRIWSVFGRAEVDLFTSAENTHCPLFYSLEVDALAHSWPKVHKYAFPPMKLLPLVLCKIREEKESILLVAPKGPNKLWFPELVEMLVAPPWTIPLKRDLLSQAQGKIWHPNPESWSLHVWPLDGACQ